MAYSLIETPAVMSYTVLREETHLASGRVEPNILFHENVAQSGNIFVKKIKKRTMLPQANPIPIGSNVWSEHAPRKSCNLHELRGQSQTRCLPGQPARSASGRAELDILLQKNLAHRAKFSCKR
jgi:hypothetical protein